MPYFDPKEYLQPCKNEGDCRKLMFEDMGITWQDYYPKFGHITVITDSPMGFPVNRGQFRCCTQCHLPLNRAEAALANKLYGFTTADIPLPDDDFMRLLNEF